MSKFASVRHSVGLCQRCGVKAKLNSLVKDGQNPNLLVHPWCRDILHEQQKRQIKEDAVILKHPSPDVDDMTGGDHEGQALVDVIVEGPDQYFGGA